MSLSFAGALAVTGAGLLAGAVNAVVGSGSLVTFPTLLALGYPSVIANVTNTVGLVPGSASAVFGYRRELAGQGGNIRALVPWSMAGGVTGGVLLLVLPARVFAAVVPALVLAATVLVLVAPRVSAAMAARGRVRTDAGPLLRGGIYLAGVYGGYFGAAQGVLLIGLLGLLLPVGLQQANGLKNMLAAVVNAVAAGYFVAFAHVAWLPALLIAVSSSVGGTLGARYGRRLPAGVLRVVVAIVGTVVAIILIVQDTG